MGGENKRSVLDVDYTWQDLLAVLPSSAPCLLPVPSGRFMNCISSAKIHLSLLPLCVLEVPLEHFQNQQELGIKLTFFFHFVMKQNDMLFDFRSHCSFCSDRGVQFCKDYFLG